MKHQETYPPTHPSIIPPLHSLLQHHLSTPNPINTSKMSSKKRHYYHYYYPLIRALVFLLAFLSLFILLHNTSTTSSSQDPKFAEAVVHRGGVYGGRPSLHISKRRVPNGPDPIHNRFVIVLLKFVGHETDPFNESRKLRKTPGPSVEWSYKIRMYFQENYDQNETVLKTLIAKHPTFRSQALN
ncbi:hypothetical protein Ccrd_016072 [Cynara cardunculus var. scolymus]|uniref:Uncharacterized protein n=1 Tax=Cynara cardunculus var. scolymus TaxID=59895 RepID=A0A124SG80_CYNCS|nr:hypothetical protein Ccrd_016072 [Cynara cardunculus var. scolymus]